MKLQLLFLLLMTFMTFASTEVPTCGKCMENSVACISETQFHICYNDHPDQNLLYQCPENMVCTSLLDVCIEVQRKEPVCMSHDKHFCGKCARPHDLNSPHKSFSCVGPKLFKFCENDTASSGPYICPKDTYCNMHSYEETGRVCVPECVINAFQYPWTCTKELSPNESIILTPKDLENACLDYDARINIGCFNISNSFDRNCESYIRCTRKNNGRVEGVVVNCDRGYYNFELNKCENIRPDGCYFSKTISSIPITT